MWWSLVDERVGLEEQIGIMGEVLLQSVMDGRDGGGRPGLDEDGGGPWGTGRVMFHDAKMIHSEV